jgi:hypothetical protein
MMSVSGAFEQDDNRTVRAGNVDVSGARVSTNTRRYPWHILSMAIIAALALLLFYQHFNHPGTLLHVDMSFPVSLDRMFHTLRSMWYQYGSLSVVWNSLSVLWLYPTLLIAKLLGLSSSTYLLLLFISTFALAGISMYALAYNIIKEFNFSDSSIYAAHAGAVIAALIYMYNPWSLGHLWGYFGYPAYAVMPLAFLLLVKAMDKRKLYLVVVLVLLISVTSTAPICVVWYAILIASYALFHLVMKRFHRGSVVGTVKVLLQTAGLYLVVNALWVIPFAASQLARKPLVPVYSQFFTKSMARGISLPSSIMSNLRLSGWGGPNSVAFSSQFAAVLSFALPIFAILALYILRDRVRNNRKALYMALMFVLLVLVSTGTAFILKRPYEFLEFRAPGAAALGWVIRAPDRLLFFVPAFYAAMLGALAASVMKKRVLSEHIRGSRPEQAERDMEPQAEVSDDIEGINSRLLAQNQFLLDRLEQRDTLEFTTRVIGYVLVFALILLSLYPLTLLYAQNVFNPTSIPADYQQVNDFIQKQGKDLRVVWMPFAGFGFTTTWTPEKRIGPFNVFGSNASLYNLQGTYDSTGDEQRHHAHKRLRFQTPDAIHSQVSHTRHVFEGLRFWRRVRKGPQPERGVQDELPQGLRSIRKCSTDLGGEQAIEGRFIL